MNYEQKEQLRNLYGNYSNRRDRQFTTLEEHNEMKKEQVDELIANFPELVKKICKEYKTDERSAILYIDKYAYSENQLQFIEDAKEEGLEIDYLYSGRGMFGDVCPSVTVDSHHDLKTKANTRMDSMGLHVVIYAQN